MGTRTRQFATLEPLEKLQIKEWVNYLLARSKTSNAKAFDKWLSLKGVEDDSLDNIEWKLFEECVRKPKDKTLNGMESVIPGSMAVFHKGPEDLPLWSVLNGSTVDCEAHVSKVLGHYKLFKLNMTLRQQCEAIFKLVVADNLIQDKSKNHEDELAGMVTGGYHSIEEVMAMPENMVAKSYATGRHMADTTKFKNALPLVYGQYKILNMSVVISILALIHLCVASSDIDSKMIGYYLLDGITPRALPEKFSKELNEYVINYF
ncbi:hypothetical protein SAMN05192566_0766 [Methylophilus rhizosphaerae]|uniref:Uncharacterized protein n=1 Tax=Methylophilus rhizosphaerae TaxID=492660 RepID=A0A1G9A9T9_9PROT|nr:hypothetical protein [Methylophilus rhizosphaerae]SDK24033.1 hypothetical protein SAMN05192566_0766 [Methylophilus rhizosphaerae]